MKRRLSCYFIFIFFSLYFYFEIQTLEHTLSYMRCNLLAFFSGWTDTRDYVSLDVTEKKRKGKKKVVHFVVQWCCRCCCWCSFLRQDKRMNEVKKNLKFFSFFFFCDHFHLIAFFSYSLPSGHSLFIFFYSESKFQLF